MSLFPPMNQEAEEAQRELLRLLRSRSFKAPFVDVDKLHNDLLVVVARLETLLAQTDGLEGFTDGIEGLLTTLNGLVDGVEGLLTAIDGRVDGLEGLATTLNGLVDGLETQMDTLIATLVLTNTHVDGLEALITTLNGLVDQIEGYTDLIETKLDSLITAVGQRPSQKTGRTHVQAALSNQTATATVHTVTADKDLYVHTITLTAQNTNVASGSVLEIRDDATLVIPVNLPIAGLTAQPVQTQLIPALFTSDEPWKFGTNLNVTVVSGTPRYSIAVVGYEE